MVEEASCVVFSVCESSGLCYLAGLAVFKELKMLALHSRAVRFLGAIFGTVVYSFKVV